MRRRPRPRRSLLNSERNSWIALNQVVVDWMGVGIFFFFVFFCFDLVQYTYVWYEPAVLYQEFIFSLIHVIFVLVYLVVCSDITLDVSFHIFLILICLLLLWP
jgi:hypothetical protein